MQIYIHNDLLELDCRLKSVVSDKIKQRLDVIMSNSIISIFVIGKKTHFSFNNLFYLNISTKNIFE